MASRKQKILIFRIGQLGDSLISVPALKMIRARWPEAEISLLFDQHLGKQWILAQALLEGSGLVDHFVAYPIGYSRIEKLKCVVSQLSLIRLLRARRFDCVVHLEPEFKTYVRSKRDRLFFRLSGIRRQITTRQYRVPRIVEKPLKPIEHETDFFIRVLRSEGFDALPEGCLYDLNLGCVDAQEWLAAKSALDLPSQNQLIGVGIGSKMQSKRWPADRYTAVLKRLIVKTAVCPVFFGGSEDHAPAQEVIESLGCGLNVCGRLSLRGSVSALADCKFYLGNDTGTMHLAVAAGLRCVGVFSARDVPGKWYPYGEGHIVHRVSVDCEGCLLYECHEQKRKCLTAIGVDEVYDSCIEILERNIAIGK